MSTHCWEILVKQGRPFRTYMAYEGEDLTVIGTFAEIAEYYNKPIRTVTNWSTKKHKTIGSRKKKVFLYKQEDGS